MSPNQAKVPRRKGLPNVQTVVILGASKNVTVITAKSEASGQIDDFRTVARTARAKGRTAIIAPLTRSPELFEGTEADLEAATNVLRGKDNSTMIGTMLTTNRGRNEMIRATPDGALITELAAMRGYGLSPVLVTGLIEAAARYDQNQQLIIHLNEESGAITMAVNMPSAVDVISSRVPPKSTPLDHVIELAGNVISELTPHGNLTILLLGDLTKHANELSNVFQSDEQLQVQTIPLTQVEAARQLITHTVTPTGNLSTLFIPLKTQSKLKDFYPHAGIGVTFLTVAGVLFGLTNAANATTLSIRQDTAKLELKAKKAEALRVQNDAKELSVNQAKQLASDRGVITKDLQTITQTFAGQSARIDSINGPAAGSENNSEFDGKTVRNTYTLIALTDSASHAEALIQALSVTPYASNIQSIDCDTSNEPGCRLSLTLGMTNPAPTPESP